MSTRLIIETVEPAAINALMQLEDYLSTITISKKNAELIKIRASQINGCTYCIAMHISKAIKNGESRERIDLIGQWRDHLTVFTEEEQLLLAITEEITLININGLSDRLYTAAELHFGQRETAQIIMIVIVINAWNRLAISLKTKWPG